MSISRRYSPSSDHAAIAAIATTQHGVVSRAQLRRTGLSTAAIDNRVKTSRLFPLSAGCTRSATARLRITRRRWPRCWRAVPTRCSVTGRQPPCGRWASVADTYRGQRARISGVLAHRCRAVEGTREFGIPVTTPVRTLLDLAGTVDDAVLIRAANEARLAGRLPPHDFALVVDRMPRRLARLLAPRGAPTRSIFEDEFLRFVRRYGLPIPEVNQRVAGHEVDMLWRRERLIVELDGRAFHDDECAFERDRERDADLPGRGPSRRSRHMAQVDRGGGARGGPARVAAGRAA